jgi:argininosuccinate synthase
MSETAGRVVLAYSGGLDTSVILKWLVNRGHEVVAYVADVGQEEDFDRVHDKALASGAASVRVEDLKQEFVTDFIYPAFKANAIYEGCYLLGTALARPLIARKQIEIAHEEEAPFVSHGATGKGNDQVRFELAYYALDPTIKVISPWKDPEFLACFRGRPELLAYAEEHGIPVTASRDKSYSEDDNLLHISHESGILEDPAHEPDETVFSRTTAPEAAPDQATRIRIDFKDGLPSRVETAAVHLPQPAGQRERDRPARSGREPFRRREVPRDLRDSRRYDPPRGPPGHRGHCHGPRGAAAARHALVQAERGHLQRVLVQPRDGLPDGGHRQEPGGHRR